LHYNGRAFAVSQRNAPAGALGSRTEVTKFFRIRHGGTLLAGNSAGAIPGKANVCLAKS
jgi:hypothetical protein